MSRRNLAVGSKIGMRASASSGSKAAFAGLECRPPRGSFGAECDAHRSSDVIEGERILLAAAADAARAVPPDPATFIHDTVFSGREVGDDPVNSALDEASGHGTRRSKGATC